MILLHAPAFKNAYKMSYYSLEMFPKVKKIISIPLPIQSHGACKVCVHIIFNSMVAYLFCQYFPLLSISYVVLINTFP